MSVIETVPINNKTWLRLITRIQVPSEVRKKGVGTYLLNTLCELADREEIALCIQLSPKAKVYQIKWYKQNKFIPANETIMYRLPKGINMSGEDILFEFKKMMDD
jgi:GNAT superfamily N-acetyltransferase